MCPVPLMHERHGPIIQVAATPLQRGDKEDEQCVRFWKSRREEDLEIRIAMGVGWGGVLDIVRSATAGGRPRSGAGPCRGLCDACAQFCSCCPSRRARPGPSPCPSSAPSAPLDSPYLCGCGSSAPSARSSCALRVRGSRQCRSEEYECEYRRAISGEGQFCWFLYWLLYPLRQKSSKCMYHSHGRSSLYCIPSHITFFSLFN